MELQLKCPECGSEDICILIWADKNLEFFDHYFPEENSYYMGDVIPQQNCRCFDCDYGFNIEENEIK